MNKLKCLVVILGCIFVLACSESGEKKAVYDRLTGGDSKIKRSDVKFVKFSPIEEDFACYAVNTGNNAEDVQLLMHKNQEKWTVDEVMIGSHEKGIQKVELMVREAKEEPAVKKAILERLNDPESARFGEFTLAGDNACMTVNARNAMGGYTGNQEIMLVKINSEWVAMDLPMKTLGHSFCVGVIERELSKAQKLQKVVRNAVHRGKILQTLKSGAYSYVEIQEKNGNMWVATLNEIFDKEKVEIGDTVEFPDSEPLVDFENKVLNKKFEFIIFAIEFKKII